MTTVLSPILHAYLQCDLDYLPPMKRQGKLKTNRIKQKRHCMTSEATSEKVVKSFLPYSLEYSLLKPSGRYHVRCPTAPQAAMLRGSSTSPCAQTTWRSSQTTWREKEAWLPQVFCMLPPFYPSVPAPGNVLLPPLKRPWARITQPNPSRMPGPQKSRHVNNFFFIKFVVIGDAARKQ